MNLKRNKHFRCQILAQKTLISKPGILIRGKNTKIKKKKSKIMTVVLYWLINIYREVVAHGSLVDERDVAVGDLSGLAALAALAARDVAQLLSVLLQVDEFKEKRN